MFAKPLVRFLVIKTLTLTLSSVCLRGWLIYLTTLSEVPIKQQSASKRFRAESSVFSDRLFSLEGPPFIDLHLINFLTCCHCFCPTFNNFYVPVLQPLTRDVTCQCDAPFLKNVSIQTVPQKPKRRSQGEVIGY